MENKKRLIDANALIQNHGNDVTNWDKPYAVKISSIENAPTVDAVEVVHGEWSTIEDDYCGLTALQCSKCNQEYWFEDELPIGIYNYCPNCGAKMDGDGNG